MKVIHPPKRRSRVYHENELSVFLAGSIEHNRASEWQKRLIRALDEKVNPEIESHLVVFNPRRPDWDERWNSNSHPKFVEQVNWELDHIERSDLVIFVFDPDTKSPVTLMELGLVLGDPDGPTCIVYCPDGYWRKGNVDILVERCAKERSTVTSVNDLGEMVEAVLGWAQTVESE